MRGFPPQIWSTKLTPMITSEACKDKLKVGVPRGGGSTSAKNHFPQRIATRGRTVLSPKENAGDGHMCIHKWHLRWHGPDAPIIRIGS